MISVENIGISFNGNYLFNNVSFQLKGGEKVGLVGKNGAGKSTLLKLLSGTIEYDNGNLVIPKEYSVGYLKQDLQTQGDNSVREEAMKAFEDEAELEKEFEEISKQLETRVDYESDEYSVLIQRISDLGAELEMSDSSKREGEADKILIGLGFKSTDLDKNIRTFSGGWRMRVELAKILLMTPDALLLDEPTNHLDIESIDWLEKYLVTYTGILVLISHDQEFLDNVTKRTLEISVGKIYDFKVGYTKYLDQRDILFEQQLAAKVNQDKKIEEIERFISRFRAQANKAAAVQSRIKQLDKVVRIEVDERKVDAMKMRFPEPPRSGKAVVTIDKVAKSFGDNQVLDDINLIVGRGEKIAFVGKNGEGKSTLAKMIVGEFEGEGSIELGHNINLGYYAQNQAEELDLNKTVFETIDDVARGEIRKKVRELLGSFLFRGEDIDKKVSVLSGGEKGRLALCKLLLEPYNFLILDEPTNHLDIPSKEILKEALIHYPGAMIVVSHDREFLRGLSNKVFEFKNKGIIEYIGGIDFFLSQRNIEDIDDLNTPVNSLKTEKKNKVSLKTDNKVRKNLDQEVKKVNNKLGQSERKIAELEEQKTLLEADLQKPENATKPEMFTEFQKLEDAINMQMEIWENSSQELEQLEQKKKSLL
jgi:ATP-binding cassette subfamily F protein 3